MHACERESKKTFYFAWNRLCHHEIRNFSLKKLLMLAHESEGKVSVHISGRRRRTKTFVCLKAVFLTLYTVLLLRFFSLSRKKEEVKCIPSASKRIVVNRNGVLRFFFPTKERKKFGLVPPN